MEHSEQMNELAAALVKAQANIENAARDRKGNYGTYATLGSVIEACKEHLNACGISFAQMYEPSEPGTLKLTTTLIHTSGQFVSGTMTVPLPKPDPQGFGSASTYARRYALAAMVGVAPEDDDGAAASRPAQQRQQPARAQPQRQAANGTPPPSAAPLANDQQFLAILDEAFQHGEFSDADRKTVRAKVCQKYKVKEVTDLPPDARQKFIDALVNGQMDKFRLNATAAA